jgi:hypothetical protein
MNEKKGRSTTSYLNVLSFVFVGSRAVVTLSRRPEEFSLASADFASAARPAAD